MHTNIPSNDSLLTKSAFQFIKYFPFKYKYKENENSYEDVVQIQKTFDSFIGAECWYNFQDPKTQRSLKYYS